MRSILTAITTAALAFSLVAQAAPSNAAVTGFDSQYVGESDFLVRDRGEAGTFTVFFRNIGTSTWAKDVDLAACQDDKVTCNAQDATEAPFNDGWKSTVRYATHTQPTVPPGDLGTFTWKFLVPSDAAAATYRFNGALVFASTGADIHNEGYYQDVTVPAAEEPPPAGAATLESLDPEEGSIEGGDNVVITGEDFVCDGITVNFGDNEAEVVSCGATSLTVETPAADEAGEVDVTVTNAGAEASNALPFTYVDDVAPTFDSISVTGQEITLTFSEPVCVDLDDDFAEGDEFQVTINGAAQTAATVDDAEFADCDDDEFSETATVLVSGTTINPGDSIALTITAAGAAEVLDAADNSMERAQTRTAEAEADVDAPTAESAEIINATQIEVTANEPLDCAGAEAGDFTWTSDDDADEEDEAALTVACDDEVITLTFAGGMFDEGETGVLSFDGGTNDIQDLSGNDMADFDIDVTALEAEPPLIDDAALTGSGTAGFASTADSGDEITLTFSEDMAAIAQGDTIRLQDEDGTIADVTCSAGATGGNADLDSVCVLDGDELTITLQENSSDAEGTPVDGDIPGLQWPATIIDTSGITDEEGNDPDLANSDDVVVDDE